MSGEDRKYSNTRQIIDYDHVLAEAGQIALVCIDRGMLPILRGLVRERGLWRTSYATSRSDTYYTIPSTSQFEPIHRLIAQFLEDTADMAQCDDIITKLDNIAQAISASSCCDNGSGGAGSMDDIETTEVDDGATPPAGFATYPTYDAYKCNMATKLVQDWLTDIAWLNGLSLVDVATVAVGLLSPLSGQNVIDLVGVAALWFTQSIWSSSTQAIYDWLDTDQADVICGLYDAYDVTEAYDNTVAIIDAAGLTAAENFVAKLWLGNVSLNRLFDLTQTALPVGDCSGCTPYLELLYGSVVSGDLTLSPGTVVIDSVLDDPYPGCPANMPYIHLNFRGSGYRVSVTTDQTTSNVCDSDWTFYINDRCGAPGELRVPVYTTFQGVEYCVVQDGNLRIRSAVGDPFTATVTKIGDPP